MPLMSTLATCAVTGVSGYLGRRLVAALNRLPEVERVVGIDLVPPATSPDKLTFVQMDVRDAALADVLGDNGVGSLVHCAFVARAFRDQRTMFDMNVGGTRNTLDSAATSGVRSMVVLSSHSVYGAWAENPASIIETHPVRPNAGHLYAEHKIAGELLCRRFRESRPDVRLTILRPSVIVGPNCNNELGESLRSGAILPVFSDRVSALQFVHEDDLADACLLALRHRDSGLFNIGGEGSLSWAEVVRLAGRRSFTVAPRLLESLVGCLWKLGIPCLSSPSVLPLIRYPLVVDSTKARTVLGWRPRHSTASALESLVRSATYA